MANEKYNKLSLIDLFKVILLKNIYTFYLISAQNNLIKYANNSVVKRIINNL